VERFNTRLGRIGNITSDGRPILGLDSRDLLEIALEASEDAGLVPAHIWTPWFAVLGAKSGFDSVADCYRDLALHLFAVATGPAGRAAHGRATWGSSATAARERRAAARAAAWAPGAARSAARPRRASPRSGPCSTAAGGRGWTRAARPAARWAAGRSAGYGAA